MTHLRVRAIWTIGPLLAALLSASCATLRVPENVPSFNAHEFLRTAKSGLILEARPIAGRESYWDLFDENLPQLGIVAIWVNIRNDLENPVTTELRNWRLHSSVREYRMLSADELFETYYGTRRIRAYSVQGDRQARDKLQRLLLDTTRPLPGGETRSGFVFFRSRPSDASTWMSNARLVLRDVRLPARKSVTLELPLTYATPRG